MKIALTSNSFEQQYLGWQFVSVSFFSRHRLPWKNDLYDTSLHHLVYQMMNLWLVLLA